MRALLVITRAYHSCDTAVTRQHRSESGCATAQVHLAPAASADSARASHPRRLDTPPPPLRHRWGWWAAAVSGRPHRGRWALTGGCRDALDHVSHSLMLAESAPFEAMKAWSCSRASSLALGPCGVRYAQLAIRTRASERICRQELPPHLGHQTAPDRLSRGRDSDFLLLCIRHCAPFHVASCARARRCDELDWPAPCCQTTLQGWESELPKCLDRMSSLWLYVRAQWWGTAACAGSSCKHAPRC